MRNVFQAGEAFLNKSLNRSCSEIVEYCTNGVSRGIRISVTVGKTIFRVNDIGGISQRIESSDFIFDMNAIGKEPERGDYILRNGKYYEVFAPENEMCWRYSGDDSTYIRVHTHLIGHDTMIDVGGEYDSNI